MKILIELDIPRALDLVDKAIKPFQDTPRVRAVIEGTANTGTMLALQIVNGFARLMLVHKDAQYNTRAMVSLAHLDEQSAQKWAEQENERAVVSTG